VAQRVKKYGASLGIDLTVLGVVDDGPNPVYLAWHHRKWCPVACKVLKTASRARKESALLRAFDHPNIVRCLGIEEPTCLLMDYLDGPTLSSMIHAQVDKRLSISDSIRIAIHTGGALEHLHQRGYVYLDLKPSNIIITGGRPVLFDVGTVQKQLKRKQLRIIGSDDYMAPEQCSKQRVGPAADVFGLGVTLYQMLTGKLPFPPPTKPKPHPQLAEKRFSVRQRRAGVPVALDELVMSCLQHDPVQRPALAALLTDLHRHIRSGAAMWPDGFTPIRKTVRISN
jgi:eukaryotic-like serine/threonine-protein kinase